MRRLHFITTGTKKLNSGAAVGMMQIERGVTQERQQEVTELREGVGRSPEFDFVSVSSVHSC